MSLKRWRAVYILLCLLAAVWLGARLAGGDVLQTRLTALLPQESAADPLFLAAEHAQDVQMNQSVVLLIGAQDAENAFQTASVVAEQWRQSGLFSQVDAAVEPDLAALRQSLPRLGSATLPYEQARLLLDTPEHYFAERAEAAANPFAVQLLPLQEDWLGFSRFALRSDGGRWQWSGSHNMLYSEYRGQTWVLLRARLPDNAADPALLTLLADSKRTAATHGTELLAGGGALFAADAKQSAERESSLMSAAGLLLTFTLLLAVFRSPRIFTLLLPLAAGMLWGGAATVAVFGEIHALTLVVGTSLVGVLVDFPLHWLSPALFRRPDEDWIGSQTMRRVLPTFAVSLAVTVAGYLLLWFTPLPVLRQTAVFSVAALSAALAATVCWLPPLFGGYRARNDAFVRWTDRLGRTLSARSGRSLVAVLLLAAACGLFRLDTHDDIRNWMSMRPDLLDDSRRIAEISGIGSGQTVLLAAASPDGLLRQSRLLSQALHQHQAANVHSLDQWLLPADEQAALKRQLAALAEQPAHYAPLLALGIPEQAVQTALRQAAAAEPVGLAESLAAPQAEAFRTLYLGQVGGRYAALAQLSDIRDLEAVRRALPPDARLLDKRARLNEQFADTRNRAAWLKAASFAAAWLLLWRLFGLRRGSLMVAVPAVSVAAALGLLGWLGIPAGLFAVFGLLLASAIGIDYAVYALNAPETAAARTAGITLAALTTGISFSLLAGSSTPAVAAFGISVAASVLFNWALAAGLPASRSTVTRTLPDDLQQPPL